MLPALLLRDSCQCGLCCNTSTLQRQVDNLPAAVAAVSAEWAGGTLTVAIGGAGEEHVVAFGERAVLRWIEQSRAASRTPALARPRPGLSQLEGELRTWGPELADVLEAECTFDFESVLERGGTARQWATTLKRTGLTRLRGARHARGELGRLSRAVRLPLRPTIYDEGGSTTFSVRSKAGAVNQVLHAHDRRRRQPPLSAAGLHAGLHLERAATAQRFAVLPAPARHPGAALRVCRPRDRWGRLDVCRRPAGCSAAPRAYCGAPVQPAVDL